jgi:hypothetical protein
MGDPGQEPPKAADNTHLRDLFFWTVAVLLSLDTQFYLHR